MKGELESEVTVCKSKCLFLITLARVNSGYRRKEAKSRTYNSKVEVTFVNETHKGENNYE